jgi:Bacterial protein of unknown function (DUF839)
MVIIATITDILCHFSDHDGDDYNTITGSSPCWKMMKVMVQTTAFVAVLCMLFYGTPCCLAVEQGSPSSVHRLESSLRSVVAGPTRSSSSNDATRVTGTRMHFLGDLLDRLLCFYSSAGEPCGLLGLARRMHTTDSVTLGCVDACVLFPLFATHKVCGSCLGSPSSNPQIEAPNLMMTGRNGWRTTELHTVGEYVRDYLIPGIPDGMAAFDGGNNTLLVLSNHEIADNTGSYYTLGSGATLRGARISYLRIDKATRKPVDAGLAYHTIVNRNGIVVSSAVPGDPHSLDPFLTQRTSIGRFCSAGSVKANDAGFVDTIFFNGEETNEGSAFALDVATQTLYAVPWLGRGQYESVAALDVPSITNTNVALVIGDDTTGAPLLLYIGRKQLPGSGFLERNGLVGGKLHQWQADNGDTTPQDWHGTNTSRTGKFVIVNQKLANATTSNTDSLGFTKHAKLLSMGNESGAFHFSRLEDVQRNPVRGNEVVFVSTGSGNAYPSDNWGTVYIVHVILNTANIGASEIPANIRVLYDGDDATATPSRDFGLRSPDNVVWSTAGYVLVQEDKATARGIPSTPGRCNDDANVTDCLARGFGGASGEEASIWQLDPASGTVLRVAQMNRNSIPTGQVDSNPNGLGIWESSGIIELTQEMGAPSEALYLFTVQAHSVRSTDTSVNPVIVEGGQYLFLSKTL